MAEKIIIDPITRIEGHLQITAEIADGKVVNAWSTGNLFRGIEIILKGRDPRDAWLITQRSCGVCTYVHGAASVRAVEMAEGITIPDVARVVRNLMMGAQFLHDHPTHFYQLSALDWVDIVSALKADPKKTSELANNLSNAPRSGASDFRAVQNKLKAFVDSGQLGPFANAYWGHPAYKLPPEANLMATSHYLDWLRLQVRAADLMAIFGAKNPHLQSMAPGGVTCVADLNVDRLAEFLFLLQEIKAFIDDVYIPDILAVAPFYKDWAGIGGTTNFLAFGEFPQSNAEPDSLFFPRGSLQKRDLQTVHPVDPEKITESVKHSWYENSKPLHPYKGETKPKYTGYFDKDKDFKSDTKYSWVKAPRYEGQPYEVGPLARTLVSYAAGHKPTQDLVNLVLKSLNVPADALFSTLGRTAARAINCKVIAEAMGGWVNELIGRVKAGDTKTFTPYEMKDGMGYGWNDVPRGALGHWIKIKDKKIENYQYVVPSTWNFGPRCEKGLPGPVEEALMNTPVEDPRRPLELLRTVHSFDPCLACAIHVIDPQSNEVRTFKVV
ncbi:MAG: nickel-dependent hydrogenase large subunit [Deltaproteobacteria bacterium]|nr:nickel-dependent hydrogenase large subunit [Deltaproteobacteria bacterium]